ncbi:hypothetical protein BDN70DRAFT_869957 [Pholiota conissans]|uniref:Zn(2)-C6 fungal-type domain-containing protein n=1 Tax=Pholiota conissans TaxID=109636 RepID=A0A9P5ZFC7_9AGAR|nr:hypothetical protein BDN70DRAFT_869957 [Pholiota conissans]
MPTDDPAADAPSALDAQQQLQQQLQQQQQQQHQDPSSATPDSARKPKAPSVRRACVACHTGKTRCSEVLPCQSCLKRGLGGSCAYPDPDSHDSQSQQQGPSGAQLPSFRLPVNNPSSASPAANAAAAAAAAAAQFPPPPMYATLGAPNLSHQQYYDYNGTFTGASTSTFRPNKRPRNLTEEEAAAITRNFSRGDFYVGSSAPVRIDPRLPVRLTLGEGDHVHFTVGEALV